MMSKANTKKVHTKGSNRVRYSKRTMTAKMNKAVDKKNSNQ
jgi:hypothetical protein